MRPEEESFGKAHIFPRSMGGKLWLDNVCKSCNNAIGRTIESHVKKSLLLATAIANLEIQTPEKAFKHLTIRVPKTEIRLEFDKDRLKPKRKVDGNRHIVGDKKFTIERFLAWVDKERPHWLEYVREKLAEGEKRIRIAGDVFEFVDSEGNRAEFEGARFPVDLVAKVAFESMHCLGFPTSRLVGLFGARTFDVAIQSDGQKTIQVRQDFLKRVSCLQPQLLDGRKDIGTVKFRPFHRIDCYVSKNAIAYLRVGFFGALSFIVAIGDLEGCELHDPSVTGKPYIFPTTEHDLHPQESYARPEDVKDREDHLADILWNKFSD
ncbi:MAG: HNH endonuclease [candidate division Zixibacteria bacterium]|nr:HNH endonuclease [candidate division Zixibacteria bacterium]